jgi:hypothetical protein
VPEMVTGPVATNTFAKEIDSRIQRPGSGLGIALAFFKPQPPDGVGMQCYSVDAFSYTQVQVSRAALVLRPKDQDGKPLANPDGTPCGPYTLNAK